MSYEAFARVYDQLTFNVDYAGYASFIHTCLLAHNVRDGLVLDAACGTGSIDVFLRELGYDMILADDSRDMLMEASAKVPGALLLCQSMTALDLYGTVRACICTLDSVNHLPSARDVRAFFEKVSLFTEPGGVFIFDVNTPYKHREILGNRTFIYDLPDVYCVWQNHYEETDHAVGITLDFFVNADGKYTRYHDSFREIAHEPDAISALLRDTGFKDITICSDLDGTRFDGRDCERLYFCATKE